MTDIINDDYEKKSPCVGAPANLPAHFLSYRGVTHKEHGLFKDFFEIQITSPLQSHNTPLDASIHLK